MLHKNSAISVRSLSTPCSVATETDAILFYSLTILYLGATHSELQKALLLVLGCAVQCSDKEIYIDKIKNLNVQVQHDIVEFIKEVCMSVETIFGQVFVLSLQNKEFHNICCHRNKVLCCY